MYQSFFSLEKSPFRHAPDPSFLFFSDLHKEALAHLAYGLQVNGGFVVLTGKSGTGKTTICHHWIKHIKDSVDLAFITDPVQEDNELLVSICVAFNINFDVNKKTNKSIFNVLSSWMLENHQNGGKAVVVIDDAQRLSFKSLEQLRLLTNIETNNQKPLQVILIGDDELQKTLQQKALRQLAQRITVHYQLQPFSEQESCFYIQHRLNIAGSNSTIFKQSAINKIAKISHGIPGAINLLCDKSMLCAFNLQKPTVDLSDINSVKSGVYSLYKEAFSVKTYFLSGTYIVLITLVLFLYFRH
ncbi:MAG: AAA family ATPase [Psychromonas sp.]|nr:AAA family ATPase [Psychromonas sp.]